VPTKKEKQPLSVTHPELAKEAFGWDPSEVAASSHAKVSWKCSYGHTWENVIRSRVKNQRLDFARGNCPSCNSLAEKFPEIAIEAHGWNPVEFSSKSSSKLKWKCPVGHVYSSRIAQRANGSNCPICIGREVLPGFNDLVTTHPEMAKEADGWDTSSLTYGSKVKVGWKCPLGHTWKASVKSRTVGHGCPYCAGKAVWPGFNDLLTTHPELAKELVDGDPAKLSKGSRKEFTWKCPLGHTWKAHVQNRTVGYGCHYCSGRAVWPGFNDLVTTHPELAKELVDGDAAKLTKGSGKKFTWKCKLDHTWKAVVSDRTAGYGCPYCAGNSVWPGFNDLATTHPELVKELIDGNAAKLSKGSHTRFTWKCAIGHTWKASVLDRTGGHGCPSCAKFGFNPNEDGWFYFIEHSEWEMYQIGISNFPAQRMSEHKRGGWEVLELRGPMDGHLTQQWETAILRMLKANGADLSNAKIAGKFDGYSEAWSKSTFKVQSIKELMRLTEEFEEKS